MATCTTPRSRPKTGTAVPLAVVLPLPSWPVLLKPQHLSAPVAVVAQAWPSPPSMRGASGRVLTTADTVWLSTALDSCPSASVTVSVTS